MSDDVDEDWVPPEAICPGKQPKTAVLPPMMASFLKASVTKVGGCIKKVPGKKKTLGKSSGPSSSVRGGEFAAKSLSPGVIVVGKRRCRGSPGVWRLLCAHSLIRLFP